MNGRRPLRVIAAGVLALIVAGSVWGLLPLSAQPAPTATPVSPFDPGTATPTPYILPTLPPSPTPICTNAPHTRLILNYRGQVVIDGDGDPLNLREGPSTDFDPPITQLPSGAVFYVLAGPECSPLYAWFEVEYNDQRGWIAEGFGRSYFVNIYPPP
ncbi:MAG: SH3 domain-containing protein [Chloroflexi bacterium]|nr:SH3 domain-containing protein [Chloroflexota bacterium]